MATSVKAGSPDRFPTSTEVQGGGLFSDILTLVEKSAQSLTPLADSLIKYRLARDVVKVNSSQPDGNWLGAGYGDTSFTGLGGADNRGLLMIGAIAAVAVGAILIFK